MFTEELGSGLPLAIVVLTYVAFLGSYALLARWLNAITSLSRANIGIGIAQAVGDLPSYAF